MSTASAHPLPGPEGPAQREPSRAEQKARSLRLTSATGLVIGSIIGTGVFTMPAVLAAACAGTRCGRTTSSSPRCPTTCSRVTTPAGCTAASRSTRWPSRPGSGRPCTHRPGVVVGYDRNAATYTMLRKHGIEVVSAPGGELWRGRGGPRCMTCPVEREPA